MNFEQFISNPMRRFNADSWNPGATNSGARQIWPCQEISVASDITSNPLKFSKAGVTVVLPENTVLFADETLCHCQYSQSAPHQNLEAWHWEIHQFGGEKHSWNEAPNITIKAFSQILNRERDPGLVSKLETTNETVSLNSHSGL
jgi:hypothetical protein